VIPLRIGRNPPPAGATVAGRTSAALLASRGELARICDTCAGASGRPWFASSAERWLANDTGAGGGASFAITGRFTTPAGGILTAAPDCVCTRPKLASVGTTCGAEPITGA
jgi:hypothetical protein